MGIRSAHYGQVIIVQICDSDSLSPLSLSFLPCSFFCLEHRKSRISEKDPGEKQDSECEKVSIFSLPLLKLLLKFYDTVEVKESVQKF